jgi:NTE family protein
MGIEDAEQQLELCDIYIEPDLQNFSAAQFHQADSIIHRGEVAARTMLPRLRALADSLSGFPVRKSVLKALPYPDSLIIHRVDVEGNERLTGHEITGRFNVPVGEPVQVSEIEAGIDRLFGTNAFDRVTYRVRQTNERNYLTLEVQEKSQAILKAAINYDSYHEAGILLGLIRRNLWLPGSRLVAVGKLADNYRLSANYLKYVSRNQRASIAMGFRINRDKIPYFQESLAIQEFKLTESVFDLQWQYRFGHNLMFSTGIQRERLAFRPRIGIDPGFRKLIFTNHNLLAAFDVNSLDRNIFPRKGLLLQAEGKFINTHRFRIWEPNANLGFNPDSVFQFKPYFKFSLQANAYLPVHAKASVVLRAFAGYVWNQDNIFGDFYLVGAPQQIGRRHISFLGLHANEQLAATAIGGGIGWQQFVNRSFLFRMETNLGFFQSPDDVQLPQGRNIPLWGLGFTVGYQSFLGPMEFTFSLPLNTDGSGQSGIKTFISVGHRF